MKEGICSLNVNLTAHLRVQYNEVTLDGCQALCAIVHDTQCSGIIFSLVNSTCFIMSTTAKDVIPLTYKQCYHKPQYYQRVRNISEY